MARFNLVDEPWISVIANEKGETKLVSLRTLFENSHNYKSISGDSPNQDFAVMRVLLAILHTVYSRFDADGFPYEFLEVDTKMRQISDVDEDDFDEYKLELMNTWEILWGKGKFTDVVIRYLETWYDRFYLFDEMYPFYQIKAEDITPDTINKSKGSIISGKNINRLISESGNKIALFSPKFENSKNKEKLKEDEITRWLITFQGYTGLSDKVIFGKEKYTASKGWLFDIGGVFLSGKSLFSTLLLNLALVHPEEQFNKKQNPCWELESKENINKYLSNNIIDNSAELYTNWSRAIYINPETNITQPFEIEIVKLPEINHQDQFLEMMTIWRYNDSGSLKEIFTPSKHKQNKSMWRSFGLITQTYINIDEKGNNHAARKPGIIDWLINIEDIIGRIDISLHAISMKDDGNATSWVPVDEIYDSLNINDMIITDLAENGWVNRINDTVEETKSIIGHTYKKFISDLKEIRNNDNKNIVNDKVEEMYFIIDKPFRDWISSITIEDTKDKKIFEWRKTLKDIVYKQAKKIIREASPSDYTGKIVNNKFTNIATAFNEFNYWLNKKIKINN